MIAKEYKVVALRECPLPEDMQACDTPELAAKYWRTHIVTNPCYDPDRECLAVLLLNTRRRIKGHQLVSTGTLNEILVHPREVFRAAIIAAVSAIVVIHNHPSGDPQPSDADVRHARPNQGEQNRKDRFAGSHRHWRWWSARLNSATWLLRFVNQTIHASQRPAPAASRSVCRRRHVQSRRALGRDRDGRLLRDR